MSRTDPQFNLRIPVALKTKIEDSARQNKRSATAEIIARIEATFELDALMAARSLGHENHAGVFSYLAHLEARDELLTQHSPDLSHIKPKHQAGEQPTNLVTIDKTTHDKLNQLDERMTELLAALQTATFEHRGHTPSPTAKKPARKGTRPLGMDIKEWEAKQTSKE